ncbi:RHS repeat-associated core domain-containing protein [candidate division KSB1 bacterium]|nr:RHS repeat-associated core domain-containing protein [candidate division KSB1 bacterium]
MIAEYEDSDLDGDADTLTRKFIYGPGIDEPICMIVPSGANAGIYWYHFDALGSVVALSKFDTTQASIVEQYTYSAFGETTVTQGGSSGNPYRFTGRRWDGETGLYYYRARMYSPALGRFLQPDPIGYADSMNLYQYCGSNPLSYIDPWGLEEITGRIWTYEQTNVYLKEAVQASSIGYFKGPFSVFTGGEYDPRFEHPGEGFTLGSGELLSASEFGNYMAGYACAYNYGHAGEMGVLMGGDIYAFGENIVNIFMFDPPSPWYWWLDDIGSDNYLHLGFEDAAKDRIDEIFGFGFYDSYVRNKNQLLIEQERIQGLIEATNAYNEMYNKTADKRVN